MILIRFSIRKRARPAGYPFGRKVLQRKQVLVVPEMKSCKNNLSPTNTREGESFFQLKTRMIVSVN